MTNSPPAGQAAVSDIQRMLLDALSYHRAGRFNEAENLYRQILVIDPNHPDALHLLGMVEYQSGRSEAAVELIRTAIAIKPNAPSYYSNLGNVFESQGNLAEAGACYQRALLLKPDLAETNLNLGNIFRAQGDPESALICYRRALALNPKLAEAAVAESRTLLLQGDFAAGWRNFEQRWQTREFDTPMRPYPQPLWNGERVASARVLLWGEQGVGDEIMFAGLVPDALRSGNRFMLDCDPRLKALFARSFPSIDVVSGLDPATHADLDLAAHLPTGSLPALFRTSIAAFAATTSPYLKADPFARNRFRAKYDDGRKPIGLAWHTRNKQTGRSRSIELSMLAPIFAQPGICWISLQYGDPGALEAQTATANAPLLIDREVDQLANIDAFAAQIAAMNLVITIDNSTAHLSAALGVPTWLLLPFAPDWRWLLDRDGSPWYPAMRIFRQSKLGDWSSVVQRVEAALTQYAP